MKTPLGGLVLSAALAALAVAPIGDAGAATFATPSLNIGCYSTTTDVRCDIRRSRATRPSRPRGCRFDWGTAYGLTRTGRGRGLCVSDTALPNPSNPPRILRYGRSIRVNAGITCTSRRAGLTCRNRAGHGFFLSRERIRLF